MAKADQDNIVVMGIFNGIKDDVEDLGIYDESLTIGKEYKIELCDCEGKEYGYVSDTDDGDCFHARLEYFTIFNNNLEARQKQGLV